MNKHLYRQTTDLRLELSRARAAGVIHLQSRPVAHAMIVRFSIHTSLFNADLQRRRVM
jgi:hypothetical protein